MLLLIFLVKSRAFWTSYLWFFRRVIFFCLKFINCLIQLIYKTFFYILKNVVSKYTNCDFSLWILAVATTRGARAIADRAVCTTRRTRSRRQCRHRRRSSPWTAIRGSHHRPTPPASTTISITIAMIRGLPTEVLLHRPTPLRLLILGPQLVKTLFQFFHSNCLSPDKKLFQRKLNQRDQYFFLNFLYFSA